MSQILQQNLADTVVADMWGHAVPLHAIAAAARLSVADVLDRAEALRLAPRRPPDPDPAAPPR